MTVLARSRATGFTSVTASLLLGLLLLSQVFGETAPQRPVVRPQSAETAPREIPALARVVLPPPPPFAAPAEPEAPPEQVARPDPAARKSPLSPRDVGPAPKDPSPPARAEPAVEAEAAPAVTVASSRSETIADGRALLRMLEVGKGPTIEIAWPESRQHRDRLFEAFRRCLGLEVALLAPGNRLFLPDTPPGQPTVLQSDRLSRFLRSPGGEIPGAEQKLHKQIKDRHGIGEATPVRILPRNVDAALLGGLFRLLGSAYQPGSVIRARYGLQTGALRVADISIDGKETSGRLSLSFSLLRDCRTD